MQYLLETSPNALPLLHYSHEANIYLPLKNAQPGWSQSNQQTTDHQSQIPSGLVFPSEHIPCGYQSTGLL